MTALTTLDLGEDGNLLRPDDGSPVRAAAVPNFLTNRLAIPRTATDIVVFAHGWRNTRTTAEQRARQFFTLVEDRYRSERDSYPRLKAWHGYYVIVRWPSMSNPRPSGYRRIRDRAHAMTTEGRAAQALGQLLGYLNTERQLPGPSALRNASGQYLHCVGHSFGGRFLVEAVQAAADKDPPALAWNRANSRYPYTVDTLLIFQMAARPDIFTGPFARILNDDAPINGPIVLTHSRADRATGLWHRLAEGTPGIGHVGARSPANHIANATLHSIDERYRHAELDQRIVNVDAGWLFRQGRWRNPAGAHSDIWYPESAHLLLSLAELAR
ncbi:hypothetical protein ACIA8C_18380 [Nocardia sp. NPDC051321]|uniref:hypothetical protein n=1 Tax=Nocardia sp. NPDC051321 TaxID=3364323 RepID=UPI00378CAC17